VTLATIVTVALVPAMLLVCEALASGRSSSPTCCQDGDYVIERAFVEE
jgi:hypothetical protein